MLKVVNPATEEIIRELDEDTAMSVGRKASAAHAAQRGWAKTPLDERLRVARRFGELLQARREPLASLLTSEMGKPIRQARSEIDAMQGRIGFFLEHTARALADERVATLEGPPALEEVIRYEPLGVIANISAWNYPWFVGSNVFLPALLAGNAVLYKPSEHASLTGLAIADLLRDAGLPPGCFEVIIGAREAGRFVLSQDIDGIFFTGSYSTGRAIAEAAAPRMLHTQLELGGKDPAYVCDDVDIGAAAAATADGAFYNAGQSCCAVERIYVHKRIAGAFLDAFLAVVRGFVVGDPTDEHTYIGPLARPEQIAVLEDQVADAVRLGATVRAGGRRRDGRGAWFEPTVLSHVDHRMKVMRDESFGPIIGIQEVDDDAMALALMNDTEYGLTAAVYTESRSRAEKIMEGANAGTVYWNCCDRVSPRLPWAGRKHSGIGATLSIAGIRAFAQTKAWHLKSGCA